MFNRRNIIPILQNIRVERYHDKQEAKHFNRNLVRKLVNPTPYTALANKVKVTIKYIIFVALHLYSSSTPIPEMIIVLVYQ